MDNREQAKMSRNSGLANFLSGNAAVYAADTAFTNLNKLFNTDNGIANASAVLAGVNNSGFSADKLVAKNDMGAFAATLCGNAQVQLDSLGQLSVSMSLNDAETYYTSVSDADAAAHAQSAHDIMNANLAAITDDYVTAGDLKQLQSFIDTFSNMQGSSEEVHAVSPTLTSAFKSNLKTVDKDVKNLLKLGKKYKTTNIAFYNGLNKVAQIPVINIHHTTLDITAADKVSGLPVVNAAITVSNTKKTASTDAKGFCEIEILGAGNPSLNIAATGYAAYTSLIHIVAGKENSYTILLDKL